MFGESYTRATLHERLSRWEAVTYIFFMRSANYFNDETAAAMAVALGRHASGLTVLDLRWFPFASIKVLKYSSNTSIEVINWITSIKAINWIQNPAVAALLLK